MSYHPEQGYDEIFVGNTHRGEEHIDFLRRNGVKSARLAGTAYDIYGRPLPETLRPIIIRREDEPIYDELMMSLTFGGEVRR